MLILARGIGESIQIGDDITVTVTAMRNGKVRIGIDAPPAVAVHRREISEKLHRKGETRIHKLSVIEPQASQLAKEMKSA